MVHAVYCEKEASFNFFAKRNSNFVIGGGSVFILFGVTMFPDVCMEFKFFLCIKDFNIFPVMAE